MTTLINGLIDLLILRLADSINISTGANPGLLRARFGPLWIGSFYNKEAQTDGWIQVNWQFGPVRVHYELGFENRLLRWLP